MTQSHCGAYAFSPPAPAHLCQSNQVPEPGTWALIILGVVVILLLRFFGKKR